MKNVYMNAALPCSKIIKERILDAIETPRTGRTQLRGTMAVILSTLFILHTVALKAQNCPTTGTQVISVNQNTYYPGTQANVAIGATSVTLGPIGAGTNFGSIPIAIGDIVLVIQMQGAQINVPASKSSTSYGANSSGLGSGMTATNLVAGNMEFAVATNAVPIAGGTLNIASGLVYNYQYAPYGATGQYTYQVIRVPQYFNIQLGATITAPFWNGSTGGVTVLSAVSQFDFNGQTVTATGAGFRGGGGRALSGQAGLNKTDFYGVSTNNAHASKGEGVAGTPRYLDINNSLVDNVVEGYPSGSYARGGAGNAGGGASDSNPNSNDQNAGGGGGGNGGAGGLGGNGWQSFGLSGGHGGTAFQTYGPVITYYSPKRLIMGGGGGAGTSNNSSGTPGGGVASGGATGGGLVIINSTTIIGTGTVVASGALPNNTVTVDGSGGGGAGGSILIYANSGQAGITANANGGNGSDNHPIGLNATQHGPGGGGGGGVVFSNAALNIASSVTAGNYGTSFGTSATDSFGAYPGTNGVLTVTYPFAQLPPNMQICQIMILPLTLLNFTASNTSSNIVKVDWSTTDEINADYFEVERSSDNVGFTGVAQVNASNTINQVHTYTINDPLNNVTSDIVFYRLRIVDLSGKFTYSKVIPVRLGQPENAVSLFPNPVDNYTILTVFAEKPAGGVYRVIDNSGKQISTKSFSVTKGNNSILIDQLGYLSKGVYIVQVMFNNKLYNQKIIKR